ncbi:hypothetical protein C819_02018 [Lachnospiraceae bacterium 10-1]|nr:hypothetical protein C819_02018 [Lachnospiraceae bacterium 10-1]
MPDNIKVLLVGAGNMGKEYCNVLRAQQIEPIVIGRGKESAKKFQEELGLPVLTGGINCALKSLNDIPKAAIVAVNVDQLADVTAELLRCGIQRILVEKPAGMDRNQIEVLNDLAEKKSANVYVAYNRRYYASTEKALEIIKEDGGVSSFNFEFTEWSHVIETTKHLPEVKENWFLANSTHVVDLAFYLGGKPVQMSSYTGGKLTWHKRCSSYVGAGISDKGALFSYQANWAAPGRWAVEILTTKHRLYFKPMEQLAIQKIGSVKVEEIEIDDHLDKEFKPGLYKQVEAFVKDLDDGKRITLSEQLMHMDFYEKIEQINSV